MRRKNDGDKLHIASLVDDVYISGLATAINDNDMVTLRGKQADKQRTYLLI